MTINPNLLMIFKSNASKSTKLSNHLFQTQPLQQGHLNQHLLEDALDYYYYYLTVEYHALLGHIP